MISNRSRCWGVASPAQFGARVNQAGPGDQSRWYNQNHDVVIHSIFFLVNAITPNVMIFANYNPFSQGITVLQTFNHTGTLAFSVTTDNGSSSGGFWTNVLNGQTNRWWHAVAMSGSAVGNFRFFLGKTGRDRNGTIVGGTHKWPYGGANGGFTQSLSIGSTNGYLASFTFPFNGTTGTAWRVGMGTRTDGDMDLNGCVSHYQCCRFDTALNTYQKRLDWVGDAAFRFTDATEFPFMVHHLPMNELSVSTPADIIDLGNTSLAPDANFVTYDGGAGFAGHPWNDHVESDLEFSQEVTNEVVGGNEWNRSAASELRFDQPAPTEDADFEEFPISSLEFGQVVSFTMDYGRSAQNGLEIGFVVSGSKRMDRTITADLEFEQTVTPAYLYAETVTSELRFDDTGEEGTDLPEPTMNTVEFSGSVDHFIEIHKITFNLLRFDDTALKSIEIPTKEVTHELRFSGTGTERCIFPEDVSSDLEFEQVIVGSKDLEGETASSGLEFDHEEVHNITTANKITFSLQRYNHETVVEHEINRSVESDLEFSHEAQVEMILASELVFSQTLDPPEQLPEHTLELAQSVTPALLVDTKSLSSSLEFEQVVSHSIEVVKEIEQTLELVGAIIEGTPKEVSAVSSLRFVHFPDPGGIILVAENSMRFSGKAAADADYLNMRDSIARDLATFADTEVIHIIQETTNGVNAAGVQEPSDRQLYPVHHALRRQVSQRDIAVFQGRVRITDTRFEVMRADLPEGVVPKIEDRLLTEGDEEWDIVAVDDSTVRTRFRIFARK